ncbi:ORF6C domain-containing protein [[Clostridium] colinum]|uniref:ORF6C domain-containing protein n=1 Tax=[Clostridium] colinum TaxID=36835 RepID=UPI00202563D5|nr:ORF6C domain-containing protein [[Clostridium] colinum]
MNNIMIFENKKVEVFELNGQVLFNPYDVGDCLDLTDSAVRKAIGNMNEKQVIKLTNSIVKDIPFRKLHNTGENFLTESGVYKLIFKSNKEEAEKFQDWVTDEVLPIIRKTGVYTIQPKTPMQLLELEFQAIKEVDNKVEEVKQDLEEFKQDTPLLALEIEKITRARNRTAVNVLGGKDSNAYKNRSLRSKVYQDMSREIKRQFGVETYKAIKRNQCDKVIEIINLYVPPMYLLQEIENENLQLAI